MQNVNIIYYITSPVIGVPQKYAFWFCKVSHKFWERDVLLFAVVELIDIRLSVIWTSMICRNTIQYSNTLYGYTILCVRFAHKNKPCSSSYYNYTTTGPNTLKVRICLGFRDKDNGVYILYLSAILSSTMVILYIDDFI